MASPLTANFLAAWRRENRDLATLVKVELTSPSALTLYLGSREIATPGSPPQVWQAALADIEPIQRRARLRESSWAPMTSGFTVLDVPLAHQAAGKKALDVFRTHRWIGALVSLYFWDTSLAAAADLAPIGLKFMVQDYEVEAFRASVHVIQRWTWNREVDLLRVTRKRYPRAPEESVGKFLPKVRGAIRSVGLREPWTAEYDGTNQHGWEHVTGGQRAVAGVTVDVGSGGAGTKTRVVFASHACKTFYSLSAGFPDKGSLPYIEADDRLCLFDAAGADTFSTSTDGTGLLIGDDAAGIEPFEVAFYPVAPINIELFGTLDAADPRAVLDVVNETSFARLVYDSSLRRIKVRLPSLATAGDIVAINYAFGYRTRGGSGSVLDIQIDNGIDPPFGSTFGVSTSPVFNSHLDSTPNNDWNLGTITVQFNGVQTGVEADLFYIGAIVKFRPKRAVVGQVEKIVDWERYEHKPSGIKSFLFRDRTTVEYAPVWERRPIPSYAEHKWFATLEGYADAGGTYTGNGTDLIQRPPDIGHHLLVLEGGESSADVETGVGAFGSFVDARALLKTWRQSDMVQALVLREVERVSEPLARLCDDAGIWIRLSEFDNKWKCLVWKKGVAVDYTPKIIATDLAAPGPRLRPTAGTRRDTAIAMSYSFDEFRGRSIHDCSIGPGRSNAGHKYRNLRDQQLSVIGSGAEQNNKLDFFAGGSQWNATLGTGEYTPTSLLQEIYDELDATYNAALTHPWSIGCGPIVIAGVNDKLELQENEGAQDIVIATIAAGDHGTMEAYATAIQTAANAVSDSFTVTYSRATRLLTLARAGNTFRMGTMDAVYANNSASAAVGMARQTTAYASSIAADFGREEEMYCIGNTAFSFNLLWETGTNGTNGTNTNCANLIGYDATRDNVMDTTGRFGSFLALCPTNKREQTIAALAAATGEHAPIRIPGETIYDHDTAREVRDRAVDLLCANRPQCWFPLLNMPDMESGRVFECDNSLDAFWPYAVEGSDGSWAGKKWIALDKLQHAAGSYVTEVLAVEIS